MAIPSDISGLQFWVKSDTGITKDGGDLVSQWDDQSGNSRNLTEATNKPLWVASLINGYPAIRFNGSSQRMQTASFTTINSPFTAFLVMKLVSSTNADRIFGGTSNPIGEIVDRGSGNIRVASASSGDDSNGQVNIGTTNYGLVKCVWNGASSVIALNNGSDNTCGINLSASIAGGVQLGHQGGGSFANIEVAEIALYNSAISGSNLTDLKDYFGPRYNLGFGTAPGQPAVKRMGGVPFASPNRGVW